MDRINPKALYLYPTCFAIGSGALAGAGWLGAHLVRIIVPSIVPAAHAVAAGLWAPACLAIWLLASAINRKGGPVNHSIGVFGGYLAAIATANMMGYAVSIGPFVSLASLSFPVAAGVALIMPIGIALITITNVGRKLRDFILHTD
ncbi:MAG: hypothetical protein LLG04_12530 [Parachlamydia sp.]|nr:hypothetical protein [Parachlamydia sp.]